MAMAACAIKKTRDESKSWVENKSRKQTIRLKAGKEKKKMSKERGLAGSK